MNYRFLFLLASAVSFLTINTADFPTSIKIKYYKDMGTYRNLLGPNKIINIPITPQTTLNEIEKTLQQSVDPTGDGDLAIYYNPLQAYQGHVRFMSVSEFVQRHRNNDFQRFENDLAFVAHEPAQKTTATIIR